MRRTIHYACLLASATASIALLPADSAPPFGALPSTATTFPAWDLFERVAPSSAHPLFVRVQTPQLGDGCRLQPVNSTLPLLLLINQTSSLLAQCYSATDVLQAADAAGMDSSTLVGMYGDLPDLYDTAGPLQQISWSSQERPTRVQGIAVDPLFASAVMQRNASTPTYAYIVHESGPYNDVVSSAGFKVVRVFIGMALAVALLFGLYHFAWPLAYCFYHRKIRKDVSALPSDWISPTEARYWRPSVSTFIRLASLYCLAVWIASWPYKNTTVISALYFSSLLAALIAFMLMAYRWCRIVRQVTDSRVYAILQYWALVQVGICIMCLFLWFTQPMFPSSETYLAVRDIFTRYIAQPASLLFYLIFFGTSFYFLQSIRHLGLQPKAYRSLRNISLIGLVGFVYALYYVSSSIVSMAHVGSAVVMYAVLILSESFFWVGYHSFIFYLLSLPLPSMPTLRPTNITDGPAYETSNEEGNESEREELVEGALGRVDGAVQWNAIVLRSTARQVGEKPNAVQTGSVAAVPVLERSLGDD